MRRQSVFSQSRNSPHFMEPEGSLPHSHLLATCHNPGTRQVFIFRYKASSYDEEFLTPRRTSKLEDHPLSATFDCLFNIFAATLHTAGRSSIRNLKTRLAVVTGTHLSRGCKYHVVIVGRNNRMYKIKAVPVLCTVGRMDSVKVELR